MLAKSDFIQRLDWAAQVNISQHKGPLGEFAGWRDDSEPVGRVSWSWVTIFGHPKVRWPPQKVLQNAHTQTHKQNKTRPECVCTWAYGGG